jgi:2-haloacid dehalogenase
MQVEGIAFDAFGTLFDLEALREPLGDEVFEGFAARLVPWTWHMTAAGAFRPLPEIARAAVEAAGAEEPDAVVHGLQRLPAFDDVVPGLEALASRRLAVLSNGTADGVRALVSNAGLDGRFEHLLAADQAGRYKPAPELYALAPRAFGVPADRVLLVSSNEWDIAGAAWSGLRTAWLGRGREPSWVMGSEPDLVLGSLGGLAAALETQ